MRAEVFTWRGKSLDLASRYRTAPTALGNRLPVMEIKVCSVEPAFCDLANLGGRPTSMCSRNASSRSAYASTSPQHGEGGAGTALVHLTASCPYRALQSGQLRATAVSPSTHDCSGTTNLRRTAAMYRPKRRRFPS
jgi:hypothetical protein